LSACTFKEQVSIREQDDDDQESRSIKGVSSSLRSAINPDQREIYYNEEKRELTITIPRMIEQNKGIDGDGE